MTIRVVLLLALLMGAGVPRIAAAQEVLFELPPRVGAALSVGPDGRRAPLRGGAQVTHERNERMQYSPGLSLLYRPCAPSPERDFAAATQLGFALRAPTEGSMRQAAERSLTAGSAAVIETRGSVSHQLVPGLLLLSAQVYARLDWALARTHPAAGGSWDRIAPLLGSAGAVAGAGIGFFWTSVELAASQQLWAGGAGDAYREAAERVPRLALHALLNLMPAIQFFLRVRPHDGFFSSGDTWTVGVAGNVAVFGE